MGKYLVLLAGIAGVVAFFLPIMRIRLKEREFGVSTLQIMRGIRGMEEAIGEKAGESKEEREALEETEEGLRKVKGIFLAFFGPAAVLLLLGVLTRVGRGVGILALIVGLIGFGGWALMNYAVSEAGKQSADAETGTGLGLTLLLVSALLGVVGGIVAIAKPPRRPDEGVPA